MTSEDSASVNSHDPHQMRLQNIDLLKQMGSVLRELADEVEAAIHPDTEIDVTLLQRIATDLETNRRTINTLNEVNQKIELIHRRLN